MEQIKLSKQIIDIYNEHKETAAQSALGHLYRAYQSQRDFEYAQYKYTNPEEK